MFVLSFKNDNDDPNRNSLGKYYMILVVIRDFNESIDKTIDQPIKSKQESYEKLVEMSRNTD